MGWKTLVMAAFWRGVMCWVESSEVQIETPNLYQYYYLRDYGVIVTGRNYITFLVRAGNDAHVLLSTDKTRSNSYEIVIGGWSSSKSVIRRCAQCEHKVLVSHSMQILDNTELRPFWISWLQGHIRVGRGTQPYNQQFMSWTDPDPHQVNHVGVSTGWGSIGTWIFGRTDY